MSCETCVSYEDKKCLRGTEGEVYCIGGGFELYENDSKKTEGKRKEIATAQTAEAFDEVLKPETGIEDEIEKVIKEEFQTEPITDEEREAMAEISEQISEPPKSFEGFNGIQKPETIVEKAESCDGCKNFSKMVGCFINKFTDCTNHGRYLYEAQEEVTMGAEAKVELDESQDAQDMVDDLLRDMEG